MKASQYFIMLDVIRSIAYEIDFYPSPFFSHPLTLPSMSLFLERVDSVCLPWCESQGRCPLTQGHHYGAVLRKISKPGIQEGSLLEAVECEA